MAKNLRPISESDLPKHLLDTGLRPISEDDLPEHLRTYASKESAGALSRAAQIASSEDGGLLAAAGSLIESALPDSRVARDTAVALGKSAASVPQIAVGLMDIPTGGRVGKALADVGFDPNKAQATLDTMYSEETQRAKKTVSDAQGFWATAAAALENPSVIATGAGESLAAMGAGGLIGRGVLALAPRLAKVPLIGGAMSRVGTRGAGAIGEGTVMAGTAAENIRSQTEDGLLTPGQSAAALATGGVGAVVGRLGAKIGDAAKVGDIDSAMVGRLGAEAGDAAKLGVINRTARGGAVETGEEMVQSGAEQALQNVALGKDAGEGVGGAMALGGLTGAPFGMVAANMPRAKAADAPATDPQAELDAKLAQLERAVKDLRGSDPIQTGNAVQSAGSVDEAIAVADVEAAVPVAAAAQAAVADTDANGRVGAALQAEAARMQKQAEAMKEVARQIGVAPAAPQSSAGDGPQNQATATVTPQADLPARARAQAAGTPDLKPGEARVLQRGAPLTELQERAASASEGQLTPSQRVELARKQTQAAPAADRVDPVQQAAQAAQTAPATTMADVNRVAQEAESDVLARWQQEYDTKAREDVAAEAEAAVNAAAESRRVAMESQDETATGDLNRIAQAERSKAVDQLVRATAEGVQYSSAATVASVNRRLLDLKMEPLSRGERGRVARLLDGARTFAIQPPQAAAPVRDRGANNASMEARIPEQRPPMAAPPKKTRAEKALQRKLQTMDRRGAADGVLPEAAAMPETQAPTGPADVASIYDRAQLSGLERALQRGERFDPVAEAAGAVDASRTGQADVERLAAGAREQRAESRAESDAATQRRLDAGERQRAVDEIADSVAPSLQYGSTATVRGVNNRLIALGMPPLTKDERTLVVRRTESARTFAIPQQEPTPVPVRDRSADNAAMEALIPEKKPKVKRSEQRGDAPYTHGDSRLLAPVDVGRALARQGPGGMTRQEYRMANVMARLFGRRLNLFEATAPNAPDGYIIDGDPNNIYLNIESEQSHLVVLGHELLHSIKMQMPEAYDAILATVKIRTGADLNVPGINGDMEEVTADLVGNLFAQPDFWLEVMGQMTVPQARGLGDLIGSVIDRMVKALGGMRGYATGGMVENLDDVRNAASAALAQFLDADVGRGAQAAGNSGAFDPDIRKSERRAMVRTPTFKAWFGDWEKDPANASKVLDENGEPLVVYTGTSKDKDFTKFNIPKNGAWFTTSTEDASMYAKQNDSQNIKYEGGKFVEVNTASRVMPVYLRIKNPAILSDEDLGKMRAASNYKKVQGQIFDKLRAQGYDGVNLGGGVWVVIADAKQVKSALGNSGAFDPKNPDIRKSERRGFDRFTAGAKVVRLGDGHRFRAGEPVVVEALHGTTSDFTSFSTAKGNIESDLGAGFYFSNTPEDVDNNYAGIGPDLKTKIEQEAERVMAAAEDSGEDMSFDEAKRIAEQRWVSHGGQTMKVWVKMTNPVVLGGPRETVLTFDEAYDEESDTYGEPTGTLIDLTNALIEEAGSDRYYDADVRKLVDNAMTAAMEDGDIPASAFISMAKMDEYAGGATDADTGGLAINEIVRRAFEAVGYDGFIDQTVDVKFGSQSPGGRAGRGMKGMRPSTTHFIAFKPTQIKSATGNQGAYDETDPDIRMSAKRSPLGFYSALAQGVAGIKAQAAPAGGWKDAIKGLVNKGVAKADEVEWSGVNDWLDLQQGKVTKEQVAQYLEQGGVQVEETVLADAVGLQFELTDALEPFGYSALADAEDEVTFLDENGEAVNYDDLPPEARAVVDTFPREAAKYGGYVLPGGTSYREVLLTLPEQKQEISRRLININYRSPHWDQPNVLAHIRVNDHTVTRTSPLTAEQEKDNAQRERMLQDLGDLRKRINELGREVERKHSAAWKAELSKYPDLKGIEATDRAMVALRDVKYPESAEKARLQDEFNALAKQLPAGHSPKKTTSNVLFVEELQSDWGQDARKKGFGNAGVPAAPFIAATEGWLNLTLKRVITMAVEGGYDKVAFVNGKQSADRYQLSSVVESINVPAVERDGSRFLLISGQKDMRMRVLGDGTVVDASYDDLNGKTLDAVIGKDLADKVMAAKQGDVFSGLDLQVGGKGMIKFYDEVVPTTLKKLLPKVGGGRLVSVDIGSMDTEQGRKDDALLAELGVEVKGARPAGQIGFDVTEAMREKVASGLPLFSAKRNNAGAVINSVWQMPEGRTADAVRYKLQDKYIDLKDAVDSITARGRTVSDEANPWVRETMSHGREDKRAKEFVIREVQPMLDKIRDSGLTIEQVEEYLHNRHAEERNRQVAYIGGMLDGGSGILTADARAYLGKLAPPLRAKLDDVAGMIDEITRGTRDYLVASGLEKQSVIEDWESAYDSYVPLNREEYEDIQGSGRGMGYSVRGAASKRAMGSDKAVSNILANVVRQREVAISRAEKARVGASVFAMFTLHPNTDIAITIDPGMVGKKKRDDEETRLALMRMGLSPDDAESIVREPKTKRVDPATGKIVWEVNPALRNRDNVLAVRVNGEDKFVFFNETDPRANRMVRALKNLDVPQLGELMQTIGAGTRWLSSVNTQYNPVFGIFNLLRDFQAAMFNLTSTAIAGAQGQIAGDAMPAMLGVLRSAAAQRKGGRARGEWSDLWEQFQDDGGQTGYRSNFASPADRQANIKLLFDPSSWTKTKWGKVFTAGGTLAVPMEAARKLGAPAFNALSDFNEAIENGIRLASYKAALDKGMTRQQAADIAKNLTVNFNRKGQIATQAGALYSFFNASVQGSDRLMQTLRGPMGKRILAGGMMLGVMQALALAMAGYDDDDVKEFVKDRSLVVPDFLGMTGDVKNYAAIPMPLGLHVLPTFARRTTEFVMGGMKDPAKYILGMFDFMADSFNPVGGGGDAIAAATPSVADPFIALARNQDWTGNAIAKEDRSSLDPTPGFTRSKDGATLFGKTVSEALNWATGGTEFRPGMASPTPDQVDYLVGQVFGGVAREVSKGDQILRGAVTGEGAPISKWPLVGKLVGSVKEASAERGRFYDNLVLMNGHEREIKGRIEAGRQSTLQDYFDENPEARLWQSAAKIERDVQKANKEKRKIIEAGGDRERVKAIEAEVARRMKMFNDLVRAAKDRQNVGG